MLDIRLFGPMRLSHTGGQIGRPPRRDVRLTLAYLLLHRGQPHARGAVAAALWPNAAESVALARLRRGLHRLTCLLPPAPPGQPWITRTAGTMQWNPEAPYRLDLEVFETLDRRCSRSQATRQPEQLHADLKRAVGLVTGELLENDDNEWIAAARQHVDHRYAHLLEQLAEVSEVLGDTRGAVAAAARLVERDPLREEAHRRLMEMYLDGGDPVAALRQYARCRTILRTELEIEPHAETKALMQAIRDQREGMTAGAPPARERPRTADVSPKTCDDLPVILDRFIGRADEIREGARRLQRERLLTITGPPGCGKSRLALCLANHVRKDMAGGVRWVDVSTIESPTVALHAIGAACGCAAGATFSDVPQALEGRQSLLVIDNCEHLADACSGIAEVLLLTCPELRIMSTSRVPLEAPAALTWRISGLSLHIPPPRVGDGAAREAPNEAVALLVDRARHRLAGFSLTPDQLTAADEICRRLDGLPLAIELAVTHIPALTVSEIAARLDDPFTLLVTDQRFGTSRYRSWHAALDASFRQLAPAERRLLRQLAAAEGCFTLDEADALVSGLRPGTDLLARLERLFDHGVIELCSDDERTTCYHLTESVRAFAALRDAPSAISQNPHSAR